MGDHEVLQHRSSEQKTSIRELEGSMIWSETWSILPAGLRMI